MSQSRPWPRGGGYACYGILALASVCGSISGGSATPDEVDVLRGHLAEDVRAIVRERFTPAPAVQVDGQAIVIQFDTREYTVHSRQKTGGWSAETRKVIGPNAGGMRIEIVVRAAPYAGALRRPDSIPQAYTPGTLVRGPYFDTYCSKTDFAPSLAAASRGTAESPGTALDRDGRQGGGLSTNINVGIDGPVEPAAWIHRRLLERCRERGLLPPASAPAWHNQLPPDLQSDDPQKRADAFARLFGANTGADGRAATAQGTADPPTALRDRTTAEVAAVLGRPTQVGRMQHGDDEWLQAIYVLERCPRGLGAAGREAWQQGWRYSPSVYFHNRRSSSHAEFRRAFGVDSTSMLPRRLMFSPMPEFP